MVDVSNLERRIDNYIGNGYINSGLIFSRVYTTPGINPVEDLVYEKRVSKVQSRIDPNKMEFYMEDVEVPKNWSQHATDIIASKYFRKGGVLSDPQGTERSAKQVISRVAEATRYFGESREYFATPEDAQIFEDELKYLLINQHAAFNSPVWFNQGLNYKYGIEGRPAGNWAWDFETEKVAPTKDGYSRPQCSACFIQSVDDDLMSLLDLQKSEVRVFKYGSGTGTNFSNIRSKGERLSGGGESSGIMSFLKGFDAWAGAIKSGGTTRRAAKMIILNYDHPEILEFIDMKANAEKIVQALIREGFSSDFEGDAYTAVSGQQANISVRVTDDFMKLLERDGTYFTTNRFDGKPREKLKARDVFKMIAQAAYESGDPGIQYDTTINDWHTVPNTGRINASNPCSEYMHLDDSACNLASLNLMKFVDPQGNFDFVKYEHAIDVIITAQEILVDNASYPTEAIAQNTHNLRPLGIGYSNLGALLMTMGVPYDSDKGRSIAASLTAILTGESYKRSAEIAGTKIGPFEKFEENRGPFLRVMKKHRDSSYRIEGLSHLETKLAEEARRVWDEAVSLGEKTGYRNAQASVIAPTGTISFLMDCDTTGIEPDLAIVKTKNLAGGGRMKIVNQSVSTALKNLGYEDGQIEEMMKYAYEKNTLEGALYIKEEDLPVFDTSFKSPNGTRFIHHMGHIKMMAAVQPFLSGAISKTVNMPNDITVEDIEETYRQAWEMGLKSIAIYRDGSKQSQPLEATGKKADVLEDKLESENGKPIRRKLPNTREAIIHKFDIAGHEGYVACGMYEDGTLGEIFINMSKEGSTVGGLMDTIGTLTSIALQYGVPVETLTKKFRHQKFEPRGIVYEGHPDLHTADSITDYIFSFVEKRFVKNEKEPDQRIVEIFEEKGGNIDGNYNKTSDELGGFCKECGGQMIKKGNCAEICMTCSTSNYSGCGE